MTKKAKREAQQQRRRAKRILIDGDPAACTFIVIIQDRLSEFWVVSTRDDLIGGPNNICAALSTGPDLRKLSQTWIQRHLHGHFEPYWCATRVRPAEALKQG